jgi:cell division protein FtsB
MDEEYQKEEALKDIMVKNNRIQVLEKENRILKIENKLLKEGLRCSVEAKSYKIAEQCLKELRHS